MDIVPCAACCPTLLTVLLGPAFMKAACAACACWGVEAIPSPVVAADDADPAPPAPFLCEFGGLLKAESRLEAAVLLPFVVVFVLLLLVAVEDGRLLLCCAIPVPPSVKTAPLLLLLFPLPLRYAIAPLKLSLLVSVSSYPDVQRRRNALTTPLLQARPSHLRNPAESTLSCLSANAQCITYNRRWTSYFHIDDCDTLGSTDIWKSPIFDHTDALGTCHKADVVPQ